MKKFEVPVFYRSSFISQIKEARKITDPRKKDFTPTLVDFGPVQFLMARHFGFCYGVENAIEISYRAVEENPDKRIFLLSQMIHNPDVNADLQSKGIKFIMDTAGNDIMNWDDITKDDIIIIPAFGTTLEIEKKIAAKGIEPHRYNTTCPFVEKVWNRADKLGQENCTIIIHGKPTHEETRATFSHSASNGHSIVIKDMAEAKILAEFITGERKASEFETFFNNRYSEGFVVSEHLTKVGVVNQTTMLATETHAIAEFFKATMIEKFGTENLGHHFADTRDTLCYATNDNQEATYGLLREYADLAIVVGGYNSSNTSHLVELCEEKLPTYFIAGASEIEGPDAINHFIYHKKEMKRTENFLVGKSPIRIILTSGASCPDTLVEAVMDKLLSFFAHTKSKEEVLSQITQ